MANTTSIPPFAKSAPPPPPLIVLLANTDLILDPLPALLSHEDLPLKHSHSHSNRVRFHPYKVRTGQELSALSAASMNSRSPLSSASSSPRATPTPESQIPSLKPLATRLRNLQPMTANYYDSDSESSLSSASPTPRTTPAPEPSQTNAHLKHPARSPSSSASTPRATPARETPKPTVRVKKIRKPRPKGAGRESLADIVPLETGLLEKIKDDVRKLMHKYLDTSICLSSQDKDKVNIIRKQIIDKYPIMDDYNHAWPVDHMLMNLLKYTSSHNKGRALKEMATMIKQAANDAMCAANLSRVSPTFSDATLREVVDSIATRTASILDESAVPTIDYLAVQSKAVLKTLADVWSLSNLDLNFRD